MKELSIKARAGTPVKGRSQEGSNRAKTIVIRIGLMAGYGAFSLMIGLGLAGRGEGPLEPFLFLSSWVGAIYSAFPEALPERLWPGFYLVFCLFLIWIVLLDTLLAIFKKRWLKGVSFAFYIAGSFLAVLSGDPSARTPGWPPFFSVTGMVIIWAYISLDWRLATGRKKRPDGLGH